MSPSAALGSRACSDGQSQLGQIGPEVADLPPKLGNVSPDLGPKLADVFPDLGPKRREFGPNPMDYEAEDDA
jgi:hypothetical protein